MKSQKKITFARQLRRNMTQAEQLLWHNLRSRLFLNIKFRRQEPMDEYILDFICYEKKLIIELDGGQHAVEREKDLVRENYLMNKGYRILRFWNNDVLRNINGVLEVIKENCEEDGPHPGPLPQERA